MKLIAFYYTQQLESDYVIEELKGDATYKRFGERRKLPQRRGPLKRIRRIFSLIYIILWQQILVFFNFFVTHKISHMFEVWEPRLP